MDPSDATRQFYGRWVALYDALARLPVVGSWRARAVEELGLGPGDFAVEMGCGTGANLPYLREAVGPTGRVVGLDLSRAMLLRARGGAGGRGRSDRTATARGDADLVQADATRPPISGPVDGLLGTFVVAMVPDPAALVETWCDLVRPGGRLALLHFSRSDRRWAAPLNALYRAFVRLSTPGAVSGRRAVERHDARVDAALDALSERTAEFSERRLAGGFLRLASGTVPETER